MSNGVYGAKKVKFCNYLQDFTFTAVREGFEPSVQFNPYGSLANYWFEPLTHLTGFKKDGKNKLKSQIIKFNMK